MVKHIINPTTLNQICAAVGIAAQAEDVEYPLGAAYEWKPNCTPHKVLSIYPNVEWTDGTVRPAYCGSWNTGNKNIYIKH